MIGAHRLGPKELFEPSVHHVMSASVPCNQFVPLRGAPVDE